VERGGHNAIKMLLLHN